MKPWTERRQVAEALANAHVVVSERATPSGPLRGLYAARDFKPDDYVGSFHGTAMPRAHVFALVESDRALYERVVEYALETPSGAFLYPDIDSLGAHLINHSCGPNTKWAGHERGATLVRALKPIARGEEITVHYGWVGVKAAVEEKWHACACGAPHCAGTIELKLTMMWQDEEKTIGGPSIAEEEVANRLLADMANDTDANEALLHRYAEDVDKMIFGAKNLQPFDAEGYFQKLRVGATAAIVAARRTAVVCSERRVREIVRRFELPAELRT